MRDFSDLTTPQLFLIANALRQQIEKATGQAELLDRQNDEDGPAPEPLEADNINTPAPVLPHEQLPDEVQK